MARRLVLALAAVCIAFSLAAPMASASAPNPPNRLELPEGAYLGTIPENSPQAVPPDRWIFNMDTYVYLQNDRSGKCMGVAGANPNNGAAIVQWDCARRPGSDQRMHIYEVDKGSGRYRIDPFFSSSKCVGVGNSSTAPAAPLIQWSCNASETDQLFGMRLIQILDGPIYRVELWSIHSAQVVGVLGGSTANGAQVVQWPWQNVNCLGDTCWRMLFD